MKRLKDGLSDFSSQNFAAAKVFLFMAFFVLGASSMACAQEAKVFFSPKGGCTQAIVDQLSQARRSVDIAIYSLSSEDIAREIVRLKNKKVNIRILSDRAQSAQKASKTKDLKAQGVDVRLYTGGGLMHNKFAVIDRKVLITGSFNWTQNAEEDNAENLLILEDQKIGRASCRERV